MATKKTAAEPSAKKTTSPPAAKKTTRKVATKTPAEATEKVSSPDGARARKGTAAPRSARRPRSSADVGGSPQPSGKKSAASVAGDAARQLHQLTGREIEGVTGLEKTDDGWRVQVEVLEVRRIPNTTDVLALYEVDVDSDGDLVGYHRLNRYVRGAPREE
jgi:hypothetical protein